MATPVGALLLHNTFLTLSSHTPTFHYCFCLCFTFSLFRFYFNLPPPIFRLLLAFANTMALQNDIYDWCRDHRVHHKFSETNADPHNSRRGFFFAHMGWLLVRKHDHVRDKGKQSHHHNPFFERVTFFLLHLCPLFRYNCSIIEYNCRRLLLQGLSLILLFKQIFVLYSFKFGFFRLSQNFHTHFCPSLSPFLIHMQCFIL